MTLAQHRNPDDAPSQRDLMVRVILFASAFWCIGMVMVFLGGTNAFSRFVYVNVDFPGFVICLAALALLWVVAPVKARFAWLEALPVPLIALATLVVGIAGTHLVFHGFAMSPDEWMPRMQAEIFRHGDVAGTIPPEWRGYGRAMFHQFVYYDPLTGHVASSYRPGMAALIALFDFAGLGLYVCALMLAGSVLLVASLARLMWPDSASAPVVAALLTATSAQALIVAMTSYSMGPHLFFNLLWLRLFLNDRRWSHVAAAAVGVFTASLHQVHPHLFFAAPFFLLLLRPFRPWLLLWYAAAYAVGHLALLGWDRLAMGDAIAVAGAGTTTVSQFIARVGAIATWPGPLAWATMLANIARFFAWQSMALLILLFFVRGRQVWTPLVVLLAVSIGTSLIPYPVLMPDQGHGWGYRYLHGLIGSAALIGTAGWLEMERRFGDRYRGLVVMAFAVSAVVVFPLRAGLVERMASQWSGATAAAKAIDADVVIVDGLTIYSGHEIPRNDPYGTNRPVTMISLRLTPEQMRELCARYKVGVFGAAQAQRFGIPTYDLTDVFATLRGEDESVLPQQRIDELKEQLKLLASPECNRATPPASAD